MITSTYTAKTHHLLTLALVFIIPVQTHAANREPAALREALRLSKEVQRFYGNLLKTHVKKRFYAKYARQYSTIEKEMSLLVGLNKAKPLHKTSLQTSQTILSDWIRIKNRHKRTNTYLDAAAAKDKARFTGLFKSLITGKVVRYETLLHGKVPLTALPKERLPIKVLPQKPLAIQATPKQKPVTTETKQEKLLLQSKQKIQTMSAPSVTSGVYKVKLGVDKTISYPGPPGELRVWIGAKDAEFSFGADKAVAVDTLPAVGRTARITPFAPDFKVEPAKSICGQINPKGSSYQFSLYPPQSSGVYRVGANVELFDSNDCTGTPVPETTRTLQVQVNVDTVKVVKSHAAELWSIFWKKFLEFWAAFLALLFGLILFLLRKRLKKWFGYAGKDN